MLPLRLLASIALVLIGLTACEQTPVPAVAAPGSVRLAVRAASAAPADVARVTVTVSASDMAPLSTHLVSTDGVWGGVLGDIPAGPRRSPLSR